VTITVKDAQADAVRIVAGHVAAPAPEIDVSGLAQSIADGALAPSFAAATDFGTVAATTNSVTHTFTITNTGNADLLLSGAPRVTISGANAQDFTVITQPPSTIAAGATATFQVMFHPSDVGLRQAIISIDDNDSNEALYTFAVQGTGSVVGPAELIIDDSTGGYMQAGGWLTNVNSQAYQGELRSDVAGAGADHATWTFTNLAPGTYSVYTTWVPFGNRASNAPYTIADGTVSQSTVTVNQRLSPADASADGEMWKTLTTLVVTSGTLSVTLTNNANGYVIADAVRLVRDDLPAARPALTPTIHNAAMPLDVGGNGIISTFDALLVINHLLTGSSNASPAAAPQVASATPQASSATGPNYFMDVNGDGLISAFDALLVINYLLDPAAAVKTAAATTVTPAAIVVENAQPSVQPAVVSSPLPASAADQAVIQLGDVAQSASAALAIPSIVSYATASPPVPSATSAAAPVASVSSSTSLMTPAAVRLFFASSATSGYDWFVDPLDD
jgi:hypothetical protein